MSLINNADNAYDEFKKALLETGKISRNWQGELTASTQYNEETRINEGYKWLFEEAKAFVETRLSLAKKAGCWAWRLFVD